MLRIWRRWRHRWRAMRSATYTAEHDEDGNHIDLAAALARGVEDGWREVAQLNDDHPLRKWRRAAGIDPGTTEIEHTPDLKEAGAAAYARGEPTHAHQDAGGDWYDVPCDCVTPEDRAVLAAAKRWYHEHGFRRDYLPRNILGSDRDLKLAVEGLLDTYPPEGGAVTRDEQQRARIVAEVEAMAPGDRDWWHGDTPDTLVTTVNELVGLGVPAERALKAVSAVVEAIANEYGE